MGKLAHSIRRQTLIEFVKRKENNWLQVLGDGRILGKLNLWLEFYPACYLVRETISYIHITEKSTKVRAWYTIGLYFYNLICYKVLGVFIDCTLEFSTRITAKTWVLSGGCISLVVFFLVTIRVSSFPHDYFFHIKLLSGLNQYLPSCVIQ